MAFISGRIDVTPISRELTGIEKNFEKYRKAVLRDFQEILITQIRKRAPRKTGEYAESWKKGAISGDTATVETPMGMLYVILEFTGARAGVRQGKLMVFEKDGKTIFTMRVDWPGFDEMPHVRPAMKAMMRQGKAVLYANLDKLSKVYRNIADANRSKADRLKR